MTIAPPIEQSHPRPLPWSAGTTPLMLAPMQGLTNRALRSLFVDWVRPDVLFTEFMRVGAVGKTRLSGSDLRELSAQQDGVPLVVQLIGHGSESLITAAQSAESAGARHINLNMGCPYGRMTTSPTGGGLLKHPECLTELLPALRESITGTFSIKLRAGYDNPKQIFDLLPLFENSGVDFIVLHPRTVVQEYTGRADHSITEEVIRQTSVPLIANGDIRTADDGHRILAQTRATGLMLGRGAIADPLLFSRLRGVAPADPDGKEKLTQIKRYLQEVQTRYADVFCGEAQILCKIKAVVATIEDPLFAKGAKALKKTKTLKAFSAALAECD